MSYKNLNLHFIYGNALIQADSQPYTIILLNPKDIPSEIEAIKQKNHWNYFSVIDVDVQTVRYNEDEQFYPICKALFNDNFLIFKDTLPFNTSIHKRCFKKDVLFQHRLYIPENELEEMLFKHDILHSYYLKKVNFLIESIYDEYSRSFGQRIKTNRYMTQDIKINHFIGATEYHEKDVYRYSMTTKIIQILGCNDFGKSICLSFEKKINNFSL